MKGGILVEEWAGFGENNGMIILDRGNSISKGLKVKIQKLHVTNLIQVVCSIRCIELLE